MATRRNTALGDDRTLLLAVSKTDVKRGRGIKAGVLGPPYRAADVAKRRGRRRIPAFQHRRRAKTVASVQPKLGERVNDTAPRPRVFALTPPTILPSTALPPRSNGDAQPDAIHLFATIAFGHCHTTLPCLSTHAP